MLQWDRHTALVTTGKLERAVQQPGAEISWWLSWARSNDCPWDEDTWASAAGVGHIDMLQWARAQGCPWDYETYVCARICASENVVECARLNGCSQEAPEGDY